MHISDIFKIVHLFLMYVIESICKLYQVISNGFIHISKPKIYSMIHKYIFKILIK